MGTHPTNPSNIYDSGQLLSEYLADKKDWLGAAKGFKAPFDGKKAEEGHVPFLFKILCANQGGSKFYLCLEILGHVQGADGTQPYRSRYTRTRSCRRNCTRRTRTSSRTRTTSPKSPFACRTDSWDSQVSAPSKRSDRSCCPHPRSRNYRPKSRTRLRPSSRPRRAETRRAT